MVEFRQWGTVRRAIRAWWGGKLPGKTSAVRGRRRGNEGSGSTGRCFTWYIHFFILAPRGGVAQGARWGNLPVEIYPVIFTVDVDPDGIGNR